MTKRPDSTAMLTADPDSICSISKMAGGTANITEPPTLLKLLVYMAILQKLYFYITSIARNGKPAPAKAVAASAITFWNHGRTFMDLVQHILQTVAISSFLLLSAILPAHAGTPLSDRVAVEAGVQTEIAKDLAIPYKPLENLSGRTCLDGRPVDGFPGDVVEYWANLECPYCGIQEPLQAQRENSGICIVVRHIPSDGYGESLKKALSYEALRTFSANAAHRFWDSVLPKTSLGIPVPYEAALQTALQDAAIAPEAFAEALQHVAPVVSADIVAAQSRITSTPTWVLDGIRFPACDFKVGELPTALELARKVRSGDTLAKDEITQIITRGLLNESLL